MSSSGKNTSTTTKPTSSSTTAEKETTTSTGTTSTTSTKVDVKGLREYLEGKKDANGKVTGGRGITLQTFATADENWRKRALKEDYSETKTKYGWLYDQPIKETEEEETEEK